MKIRVSKMQLGRKKERKREKEKRKWPCLSRRGVSQLFQRFWLSRVRDIDDPTME